MNQSNRQFFISSKQGFYSQLGEEKATPAEYSQVKYSQKQTPTDSPDKSFVQGKQKKGDKHHSYDPLQIPADWTMAKKHALARRVAKEIKSFGVNDEICPCCGWEVERQPYAMCEPLVNLNFLGSGFPLFFNFLIYCNFLLFVQFVIKGGYNFYTNIIGTYCTQPQNPNLPPNQQCPNSWMQIISWANSVNDLDAYHFQANLDIVMVLIIMIILLMFRSSQRQLEVDVDISYISPADYTVIVRNIATGLKVNYHEELQRIFEEAYDDVKVSKIVLVHDIKDVVVLEKRIDSLVKEKQNQLQLTSLNFKDPKVVQLDREIQTLQKQLYHLERNLDQDDSKFEGVAFISFKTEDMKSKVLSQNQITLNHMYAWYLKEGKVLDTNGLNWNGKKLFIQQAPEPNEIDWVNIHVKPYDQFIGLIKSYVFSNVFMIALFLLLWAINIWKTTVVSNMTAPYTNGNIPALVQSHVLIITSIISWVIVIFNKFIIGRCFKVFVVMEKRLTKTEVNLSMAEKVTIALFFNTCLMVYIIEILIDRNIIGQGGFIQGETSVFITNAILTVAVWIIDPWYIERYYDRSRAIQNMEQCIMTQQEANSLMEEVDYSQSKRYCDVMKTMWFTFFYGDAIPVGIVINLVCMMIYYWVDKYNVLRRRTIKDTITSALSQEMIEWLEYIIILHGIGQISMVYDIYGKILWQQWFVLGLGAFYCVFPMDYVSQKLFPVEEKEEEIEYDQATLRFETDYDRENPATKHHALKAWEKIQEKLKAEHQQVTVQHIERHGGYNYQYGDNR